MHYFSLQYSAIQKTVLRHDRLWSIAGISNILSRMNEVDMPEIAEKHGGKAIVAGGGKFTARFPSRETAEKAREECFALIATKLPMLEFQVSEIHEGETFQKISDVNGRNPALDELAEQKRRFRGYAVTFNPHIMPCEECGEYPAVEEVPRWRDNKKTIKRFCRVCKTAFDESKRIASQDTADTTIQKVYHGYFKLVADACSKEPAADFNDLFPPKNNDEKDDERKRMAVWFSDLNNMNDKVPVWLKQNYEDEVLKTFSRFRDTVVEIAVKALSMTFDKPKSECLPFRLVVAGGDDLCLVMAEEYVLDFARNISAACRSIHGALPADHPLSNSWLEKNGDFSKASPKPFGFGASFVVTSINTPFSQIHRVGEELMSDAKKETDRQGNSVNWRIMAEDEAVTESLIDFERPVFIEKDNKGKLNALSFNEYLKLCREYKNISTSHRQQIIGFIARHKKNRHEVERQMKLLDATEQAKRFSGLLVDPNFRENGDTKNGTLLIERIATLFELLSVKGAGDE